MQITVDCPGCHYANPSGLAVCQACGQLLKYTGVSDSQGIPQRRERCQRSSSNDQEDFLSGLSKELKWLWGWRQAKGEVIYVSPTYMDRSRRMEPQQLVKFGLVIIGAWWAYLYREEIAYALVSLLIIQAILHTLRLGGMVRGCMSFILGMLIGRRGRQPFHRKEIPTCNIRLRCYHRTQTGHRQPYDYAVRLHGHAATRGVNLGDEVSVKGWARKGTLEVVRGYNKTTGEQF